MPSVALIIPQHSETVTRNIVRQLGAEMLARFGLPKDFNVIVREVVGSPATPEGEIGKPKDSAKPLSNDDHLIVEYTERYVENDLLSSVVFRDEYAPLFTDEVLGIKFKPTYAKVLLTLNFTFNFKNRSTVSAVQRKLRMRGGLMHHVQHHDLHYNYQLHNDILNYLYDVHVLRENNAGLNENLSDYLSRCFIKSGIGVRRSLNNKNAALVVMESQAGVVGRFSQELFYNEITESDGVYTMQMEYTLDYHQPLGIVLDYVLFIHNQRIPQRYIDSWQPVKVVDPDGEGTRSHFTDRNGHVIGRYYRADGGHRLDPIDDWFPRNPLKGTVTEVITPIVVDVNNPHSVANLHDFTTEQLTPLVKDYILAYPDLALVPYASPYLVQVFRVSDKEEEVTLTLDTQGNIESVLPLDVRRRHYLKITRMVDMGKLHVAHSVEMLKHPTRTHNVFKLLDPRVTLDDDPNWLLTVGGKYLTKRSFRQSIKRMLTTNRTYAALIETRPHYVQYGHITTHKE